MNEHKDKLDSENKFIDKNIKELETKLKVYVDRKKEVDEMLKDINDSIELLKNNTPRKNFQK